MNKLVEYLALTCDARKSALAKRRTGDLSRMGKSLEAYNKNPGVPRPGHLLSKTRMETLVKVFRVNLPASDKSRAFSASGRLASPDPDFSSEANQHPLIELTSADHVQAISQVFSARAQRVLDSKGPVERLSRRRQSFIKRFNN